MKLLSIVFFTLVFAIPAFAADLSWDQIRVDSNYHPTFPMIGFHYAGISVDQLCVEGEYLRPVSPVRDVCVRWAGQGEAVATCVEYKQVRLETPIHYDAVECAQWQGGENPVCTEYQTVHKEHRLSYSVDVYNARTWASESGPGQPLFAKEFTIPACN